MTLALRLFCFWALAPALASEGRVVVANRASASLTVIDVATDTATEVRMPPGRNTPEPMYVVSGVFPRRVFVGDRANDRVVVLDPQTFALEREIAVGSGVFHMAVSAICRQLWVVNDVDKSLSVIDLTSLAVVATIPLPGDLVELGGRPHDVILDPVRNFAYVSIVGVTGPGDYVVKYSTTRFAEVARARVGKDPHLSLTWTNTRLYVPCQGSNQLIVLDRRDLTQLAVLAIPGAHGAGMAPMGRRFYTSNFTSTGADGLVAIDTDRNVVFASAAVPIATPHNIVVLPGGGKFYVTHSGPANNQVSVYTLSPSDPTPRLVKTITAGLNPFGLDYVR